MTYSNNKATDASNFLYTLEKGGIERQQAQQQQVLTNNCDLPVECDDWAKLESWGITRGEQTDSLFVLCVLPEGWTKKATDHSMWSSLVDSQGLLRASIFYKGAFYDRKAHTYVITKRYYTSQNHDIKEGEAYQIRDSATDTTVRQYPAGYWGFMKQNRYFLGVLVEEETFVGLIYNGLFHYKPKTRFSMICDAILATQISVATFYKDFHHIAPCYDAIRAAEFLAREEAVVEADRMNKESNW